MNSLCCATYAHLKLDRIGNTEPQFTKTTDLLNLSHKDNRFTEPQSQRQQISKYQSPDNTHRNIGAQLQILPLFLCHVVDPQMWPSRAVVIVGVGHEELPSTECESIWIAQSLFQDHFTIGSIQVGLDNLWLPAPVPIEKKPEQCKNVLSRWKTVLNRAGS